MSDSKEKYQELERVMLEYYIDEDTDKLYENMMNIDFESLDYKDHFAVFVLTKYIMIRLSYRRVEGIDKLIDILKQYSAIVYTRLIGYIKMDNLAADKLIVDMEPTNIQEHIQKLISRSRVDACVEKRDEHVLRTTLLEYLDSVKEGLSEDRYKIYVHSINSIEFDTSTDIEDLEPLRKHKRKLIKMLSGYNTSTNTKKMEKCISILQESPYINPFFLKYQMCMIEVVKQGICDFVTIVYTTQKTYEMSSESEVATLMRYNGITYLLFILARIKREHGHIYIPRVNEYMNQFSASIDSLRDQEIDFNSVDHKVDYDRVPQVVLSLIFRNYYTFLFNASTNIEHKKAYALDHIQVLHRIHTKSPGLFVDLICSTYFLKDYKGVVDIFNKNRDVLLKMDRAMQLHLSNAVISSLIDTKQIQTVRELDRIFSLPKDVETNPYFRQHVARFQIIKQYIQTLEKYRGIIITLGFNVIEDYDFATDPDSVRDYDNQAVCSICCDEITQRSVTVVQCRNCKKHVGHITCIAPYICDKMRTMTPVTCPLCRHQY